MTRPIQASEPIVTKAVLAAWCEQLGYRVNDVLRIDVHADAVLVDVLDRVRNMTITYRHPVVR